MNEYDLERFKRFVMPVLDGCHLWTGHLNRGKYPQFSIDGYPVRAHRWIIEAPIDMEVHHKCGVTQCVNPVHLLLMSRSDHAALHAAERTHCQSGLHEWSAKNVYVPKDGSAGFCKPCAANRQRRRRE